MICIKKPIEKFTYSSSKLKCQVLFSEQACVRSRQWEASFPHAFSLWTLNHSRIKDVLLQKLHATIVPLVLVILGMSVILLHPLNSAKVVLEPPILVNMKWIYLTLVQRHYRNEEVHVKFSNVPKNMHYGILYVFPIYIYSIFLSKSNAQTIILS